MRGEWWWHVPDSTPFAAPRSVRRALLAHPGSELYGSDRVLLESATGLMTDGWQVLVALPGPGALASALAARGAQVVLCPTPVLRRSALTPRGIARLVAEALGGVRSVARLLRHTRPDMVYVNTLTLPLWLPLGRLHGAKTICHVHEAEASDSMFLRRIVALPLFAAHAIVANSHYSREVLSAAIPSLDRRTTVVHNGVVGPPDAQASRLRITGRVRLLYVGRLSERKGVDLIVDAMRYLDLRGIYTELNIIGATFSGYEWYEAQLRSRIARLGLNERVQFNGFVSSIWESLAGCDIAIVPSRGEESFGNVVVEAALAGRPVIVSDKAGLKEAAICVESAVIFKSDDAVSLANAVEKVTSEWTEQRDRAARGIAMMTDRYSVHGYGTRIASLAEKLLTGVA